MCKLKALERYQDKVSGIFEKISIGKTINGLVSLKINQHPAINGAKPYISIIDEQNGFEMKLTKQQAEKLNEGINSIIN